MKPQVLMRVWMLTVSGDWSGCEHLQWSVTYLSNFSRKWAVAVTQFCISTVAREKAHRIAEHISAGKEFFCCCSVRASYNNTPSPHQVTASFDDRDEKVWVKTQWQRVNFSHSYVDCERLSWSNHCDLLSWQFWCAGCTDLNSFGA